MSGILGAPIQAIAGALGQADATGVDPRFVNAVRSLLPPVDRIARMFPSTIGGGEGDGRGTQGRQLESWARFGGFPIYTLTPEQQRAEAYRRYYDVKDAYDAKVRAAGVAS